jgi:hypothetical protein
MSVRAVCLYGAGPYIANIELEKIGQRLGSRLRETRTRQMSSQQRT